MEQTNAKLIQIVKKYIIEVVENYTRNNTTCRLNDIDFLELVCHDLDKILMTKAVSRCFFDRKKKFISINMIGDTIKDIGEFIIAFSIKDEFAHSKIIFFLNEDGTKEESSYICERNFHPSISNLAIRMQGKLDKRAIKYKTYSHIDTWKELNPVALLKHFEEECLEFKSELYKFINDPNRHPTPDEKLAMEEELADVANIGFMLVERLCTFKEESNISTSEEPMIKCANCGKMIKSHLAVNDICYTCKKLENL